MKTAILFLAIVSFCFGQASAGRPDIVVADFESENYGDWKATGEAFGPGPAQGTLPRQMRVTGFEGRRLVNSFFKGDGTTGTLTSPPFEIQRKFLNFLLGGGKHPGRTCVNLLVDGKRVRTATGPNDRPGGSERLDWHAWDVGQLIGRQAVIQIVDQATGGWGHINVDQIVQSDQKRQDEPAERQITINKRYLHLPVTNGASRRWMTLTVDGRAVREFQIELATAKPDLWFFADVRPFQGKTLTVSVDLLPSGSQALASIVQSDDLPDAQNIYREKLRPAFHFTSRYGWLNDPNGLVFHQGEYHLFYQHNPYGIPWGNMTWGHAVSSDLVHWKELPDAIHPDKLGTIFSGSAVVDRGNTSGFQRGDEPPIVCIYTSAGSCVRPKVPFAQSIAYSTDRGRTLVKYEKNPVLGHIVASNRDPKVIWHEPTKRWVMALYLDKHSFALYDSPDLKKWKQLCDLPEFGDRECPDFFELPVDGKASDTRWVLWGASGNYLLGKFDGRKFTTTSGPHRSRFGANDYAAQTYSDIPPSDGRRIQISWMRGGKYPGMPFNQQMSFPRELTLRTTSDGIRLFMQPVEEIAGIRGQRHQLTGRKLAPGDNPLSAVKGELFEIDCRIAPGTAAKLGLTVRGVPIEYDVKARELSCLGKSAPLDLQDGCIQLHVLVDRASIEIFANSGRVAMCSCFLPNESNRGLGVFAEGGTAEVQSLDAWELVDTH